MKKRIATAIFLTMLLTLAGGCTDSKDTANQQQYLANRTANNRTSNRSCNCVVYYRRSKNRTATNGNYCT